MKLVVFGLAYSSSWGNGHATLWRGLCRSLAKLGHSVTFFERDVPYYAAHRDLTEIPNGELVLYLSWEEVLPQAKRHLENADVGMVTSYCADAVSATELLLDSNVPLKTFYDLDTPVTLHELRAGKDVSYLGPTRLSGFDLVLSYTGGVALDQLQSVLGARRVAPLYGSVDPDVHQPAAPVPGYQATLSYLGTFAADRQDALRMLLLEPAKKLPGKRFVIGGSQYPQDFDWASNICYVNHVPPPEHPAFYCSSAITLNVTRGAMASMGFCPSGRLFEAAACGVPLLSDWWVGIEHFFEPGAEIFLATSTQDAIEVLSLPPAALARVGRRARERTLAEHTSDARAKELVRLLTS